MSNPPPYRPHKFQDIAANLAEIRSRSNKNPMMDEQKKAGLEPYDAYQDLPWYLREDYTPPRDKRYKRDVGRMDDEMSSASLEQKYADPNVQPQPHVGVITHDFIKGIWVPKGKWEVRKYIHDRTVVDRQYNFPTNTRWSREAYKQDPKAKEMLDYMQNCAFITACHAKDTGDETLFNAMEASASFTSALNNHLGRTNRSKGNTIKYLRGSVNRLTHGKKTMQMQMQSLYDAKQRLNKALREKGKNQTKKRKK